MFSYQGALRTKLEIEMHERNAKEEEWKRRFSKGGKQSPRTTLGQNKSIDINGPKDASSSPELQGLIEFA